MKMTVEIINKHILKREITTPSSKVECLIACAFLIACEFRAADKVQFNFLSTNGSAHIEFSGSVATYYQRRNFNSESPCNLSVSVIHSFGNAYTSRINASNALNCFQEYLRLSDQRGAYLIIEPGSITKVEQLPDTKFQAKSTFLESIEISVVIN